MIRVVRHKLIPQKYSLLCIVLSFISFFILIPSLSFAFGTLQGYARDSSGFAIAGVKVDCFGGSGGTDVTGANGFYKIGLTAGTYMVQFSSPSYDTRQINSVVVNDNGLTTLSVSMLGTPLAIESVYPNLGRLDQTLQASAFGNSFDANTRVAVMPDYGNSNNIVSSANTNGYTNDVAVTGDLAYVADGDNGFLVVDISDPNGVEIISFKSTVNKSLLTPGSAQNVAVDDSRPYVYVADASGGLQVIDVSDPESPFIAGSVPTAGTAYDVAVEGNWAIIADGSAGLVVVDITDPTNPDDVGWYDTPGVAAGIAIKGNYAYVADGTGSGFLIINISDRTNPSLAGSDNTPFSCSRVAVDGNTAYVGDGSLRVYDVTNPANPVLKGTAATSGTRDLSVAGTIVYVAAWSGGLEIVDVNDPDDPVVIGSVSTPTDATGVAIADNVAYVTDWQKGLQTINVSVPTKPTIMGYFAQGMPRDIVVQGTLAYVVDITTGLVIYNISNPAAPVMIGSEFVSTPMALTVVGNFAYVADGFGGLKVIDVSDPADPTTVGSEWIDGTQGFAKGVHISGNIAYLAASEKGLHIINVSDPANPFTVHVEDTLGTANGVTVVNNIAYVADHTYGLQIIDVATPSNPVLKGHVSTAGEAEEVVVSGSYAYVASWGAGLKIINVSDWDNPSEVGSVSSGDLINARGVKVVGNMAYVSSTGLVAIDVSTKSSPVAIGLVDLSTATFALDITDEAGYLVDWYKGITIVALPGEITNFSLISPTELSISLPSPPGAGNYILRVFNSSEEDQLSGAITFTDDLRLLTSKAVIVAGGGPEATGDIWTETKAYANYAYENLIYQGYLDGDIYYLTDEVGAWGRDAAADKANLQYAITKWAKSSVGSGDLLLYFVDHGSTEVFQLRGGAESENVSALELDSWLDDYQAAARGKVIFIYDACKSGSFISSSPAARKALYPLGMDFYIEENSDTSTVQKTVEVIPAGQNRISIPSVNNVSGSAGNMAFLPAITLLLNASRGARERIIITSSRPDELAYFLDPTHSFSHHFWSTLSGNAGARSNLFEAFEQASSIMSSYQTAQLDANGNGIPNENNDFSTLQDIEGTIYALRRQYSSGLTDPVIGIVSDNQVLSGMNAPLMARSIYDMDGDEIVRVWAEIIRPDYNPNIAGVTVTNIPTVELLDPDLDSVYEGNYGDMDVSGPYIVKFFAKDAHGVVSQPKMSLVVKQN